jgi:hypothetical protein
MNPTTHQTVKLSRGKHTGPEDGACVMELASMLAGEPFTDHPSSVCPVIGSFLRTYNDLVDDHRRQALYPCASKVVGSRGSRELVRLRAEQLDQLLAEMRIRRRPWTRWMPSSLRGLGRGGIDLIAARTGRMLALHEDQVGVSVTDVVDDLLALQASDPARGSRSAARRRYYSEAERVLDLGESLETTP